MKNKDNISYNKKLKQWEYKRNNKIQIVVKIVKVLPFFLKKGNTLSKILYCYLLFLIRLELEGIIETLYINKNKIKKNQNVLI